MTDSVDRLLREAGESWRATQPAAPDPDQSRWTRSTPARRWMPALAVASATAIAAGSVSVLVYRSSGDSLTATSDPMAAAQATDLVVRDGDEVQATGMVFIAPGKPVRFCAPAINTLIDIVGVNEAPGCGYGVTVTGVNQSALARAASYDDAKVGYATLRGVWRAGVLNVIGQSAPVEHPLTPEPDLPCSPPAGGWKAGDPDVDPLLEYVGKHPDQFRPVWAAYPGKFPDSTAPATLAAVVKVLVVEMVDGDIETVRPDLTSRYAGNLCLVATPGRPSIADQVAARAEVRPPLDRLMEDEANGIYALGGADTTTVEMIMLSPALYERLAAIGFGAMELRPWLVPAR